MLTDEDITLNEDQLLDNLDDTNGDVDLMNEVNIRPKMHKQQKRRLQKVVSTIFANEAICISAITKLFYGTNNTFLPSVSILSTSLALTG